ncbi:hypothetical protein RclHR1_16180002 [Rhizophagus clarus]|uniref:Uncharacterized protein n=1 Tax=Rhizophagus clarus TaxID=94130 RepID=A0A2Z6R9S1_9GLOM|nr:hypothetical protein RclHR1_16180002 [Rhizophagus clarus]
MVSVSYDSESKSTSYETYGVFAIESFVPFYCNDPYKQVKMEENTMPSTPKFESACISPTRQRDVSVPEIRNLWND